jgi:PTS system fructose-specific IIC component
VAKELGVDIKVETHGQIGIGNKLTEEEIGEAIGVIIAADKDVDAGRFVGKRVLEVSVSKGIKNAKELMEQILEGNVPIKLGERK